LDEVINDLNFIKKEVVSIDAAIDPNGNALSPTYGIAFAAD